MTENTAKAAIPFNIKIPGYQLKQLLGKGGMASVYLAVQESFGRDVALKILSPDMARDKEFSQRFLREAQIVSRLQHPNIVTVYDVGIHQGYHYLSMEYIPGKELREAKYDLSKSEIIRIIKDVARALDYAHKNGYIHRDVKPENIMLHENGERVVLMDFGIARMTQADNSVTKTGKVIGTPHYMSPEQTKGLKVDHRTDIYSLGVVMFQMLAGRLPYDADTPVAVGIKHITDPVPLLPPGLEMFQTMINTCMSKDPAHRFQTATDLIAALDKLNPNAIAALDARAKEKQASDRIIHDPHAATAAASAIFEDETVLSEPGKHKIPPLVHPDHKKYQKHDTAEQEKPRSKSGLVFLLLLLAASVWGYFNQSIVLKYYDEKIQPTVTQLAMDYGLTPQPAPQPENEVKVGAEQQAAVEQQDVAQAEQVTTGIKEQQEIDPQAVTEELQTDNTLETTPLEQPAIVKQKAMAQNQAGQDPIQQLQASLTQQPENALQLAKLYQQKLTDNPGDLSARNGLSELRDWYRHELRDAMEDKDFVYARKLVDQLQESFPRATQRPRFQEMVTRLEHVEKVSTHLGNAKQYLAKGILTEPAGANALAEYKIVLALAPNNTIAKLGIQEIAETAYAKATYFHSRNQLIKAKQYVEAGLKAQPGHIKLNALKKKVAIRANRITRHDSLNREAEALFRSGNMIIPEGESAYDKYQQVIKENPNNLVARSGLRAIEKSLLEYAIASMENNELDKAKNVLDAAKEKFGATPIIQETEYELAKLIKASEPRVLSIVFSDKKPASITEMHNQQLKVLKTVYVGVVYENFKAQSTTLQANLLDGTGRILVASKKVKLPDQNGEIIFSMEMPTKRIADGGYKLELEDGVRKLSAGAFINDNKLP